MTRQHIRKVRLQDRTAPRRGPQAISRAPHDDFWYQTTSRGGTSGGVVVTEETAMTYATVWACVNKLSKTIATLPLHVKEHVGDDQTRNATDQPLDSLLRVRPNSEQTAVPFREAIMSNVLLWGNAFVFVRRDNDKNVVDLWLLMSRYVTIQRNDQGQLFYEYREPCKQLETYTADQILHVPGLSFDGTTGLSVIGFHRQTVGVGMGATAHVNSFLEKGAQPGIVIERPLDAPDMSPEAEDGILASFDDRHGGSTNAWRTALLREGMTLNTVSMPLKDMEFVALRRFQKGDIAGIFDVPLTKIHENERDTFSNVEQKNIDWKTDSILPWCVKLENAVDAKFFEGTRFFLKHNMEGLVRGDLTARSEYYTAGRMGGWLSVNDIRNFEDMNPIEDGDIYLSPLNMIPADQVGQEPPPAAATTETGAVSAGETTVAINGGIGPDIHGPFRRLAIEAAQRCVTKEVKAVGNAWKKHAKAGTVDDFLSWSNKFYKGHIGYTSQVMQPVVAEWAIATGQDAERYTQVCDQLLVELVAFDGHSHDVLRAVVAQTPESVPKFLEDLSDTFATSLVDELESRFSEGV